MESNIAEKELKMPFGKSVFAVLRKSALIMRSARGEASGACMEWHANVIKSYDKFSLSYLPSPVVNPGITF